MMAADFDGWHGVSPRPPAANGGGWGVFSEDGRGRAATGPISLDRFLIREFGIKLLMTAGQEYWQYL
jgi:hypothetical protein